MHDGEEFARGSGKGGVERVEIEDRWKTYWVWMILGKVFRTMESEVPN